jgi:hypothetical protein
MALFYFGLSLRRSNSKLLKTGKPSEGIVFDFVYSDNSDSNVRYPIIRFVTSDQQWITEKYNFSGLPGSFKKGQKVNVLYNPDDPKEFIIKSNATTAAPVFIFMLAVLIIAFGIRQFILHI